MDELNVLQRVAVWVLPVLFAITVHEVAHGWVARYFGDPTAMMLGRLTLNPLKHIDPVGTVLVPGVMLMLGGFIFGWAKPVPVAQRNLRNPRRDMAYVALAGPMANMAMAILWALLFKLGVLVYSLATWLALPLIFMGVAGIFINAVLMALNLLPIPPLDGGRVVAGLLPARLSDRFTALEPYGLIIVLLLLVSGWLGKILWPVISLVQGVLTSAAGIPPDLFSGILISLMGG